MNRHDKNYANHEKRNRHVFIILLASFFCWGLISALHAVNVDAAIMPMFSSENNINIYTYNFVTEAIDTVEGSSLYAQMMADINPAQTLMVYTTGADRNLPFSINVYNLSTKITTTIPGVNTVSKGQTGFNNEGKILFVDSADGVLKKMDTDGSNIVVVATPLSTYAFDYFSLSPDRSKIAIIESHRTCGDYYTCNYEKLVLMNSDGTGRTVIKSEYLGEWNFLSWRRDSKGLFYYSHYFVSSTEVPQYTLFDISGASVMTIFFSGPNWTKDENACVFTKNGNLLSIFYQQLYDGKKGNLIADVSSTVPAMGTEGMMGIGQDGEIYFANRDKTNFHRFAEENYISLLYASFTGSGIWKWNGMAWSRLNSSVATSMVASGTNLYANFTGYGLYKYNGTTWTRINTLLAASMAATDTDLYASFTGYGLYKWNGTTWTRINTLLPTNIAATNTDLYASFTGYGLYKYNGTTWAKINIEAASLTASGSDLYANFMGYGLYKYNGTTWIRIHTLLSTSMAATYTDLYANFTGYGLYKWNGTAWTRINTLLAASMAATGSDLYATFTGYWPLQMERHCLEQN